MGGMSRRCGADSALWRYSMIITLTPNPAVDVTYAVPELRHGTVHRVEQVTEAAGGKGVNVARVLAQLGEGVRCTGGGRGPRPAAEKGSTAAGCWPHSAGACAAPASWPARWAKTSRIPPPKRTSPRNGHW